MTERQRETDFQKIRRLFKRAAKRFIRRHFAKLVFIGLPLLGMIAGIASDLAALNPEYNDIRQYVSAIKETNKLYTGDIHAGDTILIPYYVGTNDMNYDEVYDKYGIRR